MLWLSTIDAAAPALPACWLVATDDRPRNLAERSALRRGLAQAVLANQLGLPPVAVTIGHDAAGRPLIANPGDSGLHLSLATRAGLVAVALADRRVGVDVERVDPTYEPPLAALHPGEREMLLALPATERPLAFARLWSAKEAYVKALGTGFLRPPDSFRVRLTAQDSFEVDDPERCRIAIGQSRLTKNGGHGTMAAAFVVLD